MKNRLSDIRDSQRIRKNCSIYAAAYIDINYLLEVINELAYYAVSNGGISRMKACEYIGIDLCDLDEWIERMAIPTPEIAVAKAIIAKEEP